MDRKGPPRRSPQKHVVLVESPAKARWSASGCAVYRPLDPFGGRQDLLECRGVSEDHGSGVVIVTAEGTNHCIGRRDHECAGNGGSEIVVGPVEEHARVSNAVSVEVGVRQCRLADVRAEQAMQVVVVPRHALSVLPVDRRVDWTPIGTVTY